MFHLDTYVVTSNIWIQSFIKHTNKNKRTVYDNITSSSLFTCHIVSFTAFYTRCRQNPEAVLLYIISNWVLKK